MPIYATTIPSPIGKIQIIATDNIVTNLFFDHQLLNMQEKENEIIIETKKQLQEYFNNQRKIFELPLAPSGTIFQKKVWEQLQKISFGSTISYLKMAIEMGNPLAIRAMATANGKNPIPIIIPCHRVIGSNGKMVGYSGGLENKKWLLQHEGSLALEIF